MITLNEGNVNENSSYHFSVIEEVLSGQKRMMITHICLCQYPCFKSWDFGFVSHRWLNMAWIKIFLLTSILHVFQRCQKPGFDSITKRFALIINISGLK